MESERERKRENMTLMRGVGLVVLTPQGVRQRSDISHTAFELRSLMRPCLSSETLSMAAMLFFHHPFGEPLGLLLYLNMYSLQATRLADILWSLFTEMKTIILVDFCCLQSEIFVMVRSKYI